MRKARVKAVPRFRLLDCEAAVHEVRTRIPFRYGKACLTSTPVLLVRLAIESKDGKRATGFASDCLPPLWFDKDPAKDHAQNVGDQIAAYLQAKEIYLLLGDKPRTAAELWSEAYPRVLDEAQSRGLNALTASFGSSFLERASIDALCRLRGLSFFAALEGNLLGMETAQVIPEKPLDVIACRHTVGLGDPLTIGEIAPQERLEDGLPQALEEDIEFYGLRYFKVKLSGDIEQDVERLSRVAALLSQRCRSGYSVSLDGNEQYHDAAGVLALFEALKRMPYGTGFLSSVLFIEQPFPRAAALDADTGAGIAEVSKVKPVIIDESDERLDSFERAVQLGYRGVSHKNCKGVFRSLLNRALIQRLNEERGEPLYFQTAEDLMNTPVVPLQEDLASICALGIEHAERNGHHYSRGLDHLPAGEAASALAAHPDLYEERQGSIFLRVVDGSILCGSVVSAKGFGYAAGIAFDQRAPLETWQATWQAR
jgi:hypothetical protein